MKVYGLTGKNAAGKGEVANFMISKGFDYHSLSDVIRNELKKKELEETRENLIAEGNLLREENGPAALAIKIKELIKNDSVIDSIRNPKEALELKKIPGFKLIVVDAPIESRFERAMKRGRDESATTLEQFREVEEKENSNNPNAQQLNETIKLGDVIIMNDSDIETLHRRIEELMAKDT